MKYTCSCMQHKAPAPAAKPAAKPFDMAASLESISVAIDEAVSLYSNVVAAEGRVDEIETVLRDLGDAKQCIEKYGVSVENMSLINKDNGFTDNLHLESLAIESIQTLSADTKKMLQQQYTTAIESQVVDMIKTAIARIKDFFVQVGKWIANQFDINAKLAKVVQNLKFDGELPDDAEVSAMTKDDAEDAIKALKDLAANISKIKSGDLNTDDKKVPESAKAKVSELGWKAEDVRKIRDDFVKEVGGVKAFSDAWKEFQTEAKKAETDANGAAAKEDKSVLDSLRESMKKWNAGRAVTGKYAAIWRKVAFSLIALDRKFKSAAAPAPAEPGK